MRVFVAVDGSSASDAVIREVARRPWPAGSEFSMVTAVDPYFFPKAGVLDETKQGTRKALEDSAQPLVEAGDKVSVNVILDNPRHALPRAAAAWNAELIVMGSHGRGSLGRLLMGSTAQAVLRHATCSVEIIRNPREGSTGLRVLVATDGSPFAEAALDSVAKRPWPTGSEFKVVSAPEAPVLGGEYPYYATEHVAELTDRSVESARRAVESGAAELATAGLTVSKEILEPSSGPAHAILAAAKDWAADLLVLGSHGRRGFDRFILGSVSETIALHAGCSVEVVRMTTTPL